MHINLLHDYRGLIIDDALLLAGVQEVADHVGMYLIGKGYAVAVDAPATPVTVVETVAIMDETPPLIETVDDDDFDPDAPSILYVDAEDDSDDEPPIAPPSKKRR